MYFRYGFVDFEVREATDDGAADLLDTPGRGTRNLLTSPSSDSSVSEPAKLGFLLPCVSVSVSSQTVEFSPEYTDGTECTVGAYVAG